MKIKKEIARYLIVVHFAGATDIIVYFILIKFLPPFISKSISYILANGVGFVFNKYWIFEKKKASYLEAGRYLILDLALFAGNIMINQAILSLWPKAIFIAVTTASVLTAALSFTFKKYWVFKKSSS